MLEVLNLETTFRTDSGAFKVIDGACFSLKKGETLGIVGESGCGKTILSLSIMKLLPPGSYISGGKILFDSTDLVELSEEKMESVRGQKISMIFQDPLSSLNPFFSIEDQLTAPLINHFGISKKEAKDQAVLMLKKTGIPASEKRILDYPHQFSGGQRQRIAIAAALLLKPDVLIADEPTTALDVSVQAQILKLLSELKEEMGMSMIFISHNLGIISDVAQRVLVMYSGSIVEEAETHNLFERPLHPYTKALIAAVPSVSGKITELKGLPGQPPEPESIIKGCKFYPRCSLRIEEKCANSVPELVQIDNGRLVRCFRADIN